MSDAQEVRPAWAAIHLPYLVAGALFLCLATLAVLIQRSYESAGDDLAALVAHERNVDLLAEIEVQAYRAALYRLTQTPDISPSDQSRNAAAQQRVGELTAALPVTPSYAVLADAARSIATATNSGRATDPTAVLRFETALQTALADQADAGRLLNERQMAGRDWFYTLLRAVGVVGLGLAVLTVMATRAALVNRIGTHRLTGERDRARIQSAEMNHRVQNLFTVVGSVVSMSARHEDDAKTLATKLRARITALATAQQLSLRNDCDLSALVRGICSAYAPTRDRLILTGEALTLPRHAMSPMGLILNELATNAVKYGAWSTERGRVTVTVETPEGDAPPLLHWVETDGPPPVANPAAGFGSTMIAALIAQVDGALQTDWTPDGLHVRLALSP